MKRSMGIVACAFILGACAGTGGRSDGGTVTTQSSTDHNGPAVPTSIESAAGSTPITPVTIARTPWTTVVRGCDDAQRRGEVVVLAASSMSTVFPLVQARLLAAYPCITGARFSYGSSSVLAAQIVGGSPADVFISASEAPMSMVANAGMAPAPIKFATNKAEIIINRASPYVGKVATLVDLLDTANPGIKVGLCVASAPCGSLAGTVLGNARGAYAADGLTRTGVADTETTSVEDLVTKVELGELDAGIVYHSDCVNARARGLAVCVEIPLSQSGLAVNAVNTYYAVALNQRGASRDFVAFIASTAFQSYIQAELGFFAP